MLGHRKLQWGVAGLGAVLAGLLGLQSGVWAAPAGYSLYYVPADETNMAIIFEESANGTVNNVSGFTDPLRSIIGITSWAGNTQVYIDHWEDGYDMDVNNPAATADETCPVQPRGGYIELRSNTVPSVVTQRPNYTGNPEQPSPSCAPTTACATPNTANGCYYDGKDKILAVGGVITLSRASIPEEVTGGPGTFTPANVQAVSWEVYPVRPQLTTYILPFGENLGAGFEIVHALLQATQDNTEIQIDFNNDGTFDAIDANRDGDCSDAGDANAGNSFKVTLGEGDVLMLNRNSDGNSGASCTAPNSGLNTATTIQGSDTLQVQYTVGDPTSSGTDWEIRNYSAFPRGLWDNEYYAPVDGTTGAGTDIYLHNPHDTALIVNYQNTAGSGSLVVPANGTVSYVTLVGSQPPNNSATYFSSNDGRVFWGVSAIDTNSRDYDWGYSLVPAYLLEDEYFIGWAPSDSATPPGGTDADANGVFITPARDNTQLFVDYDRNGTVDSTYTLDRLQTIFLCDQDNSANCNTSGNTNPQNDADMSGAIVWATGPFIAAFGQNPQNTTAGNGLDLGYTTLPGADFVDLVIDVNKMTDPAIHDTGTGEIAKYTIAVNTDEFDISNVTVVDTLATGWGYCTGTNTPVAGCLPPVVTFPDGSTSADGPNVSGQVLTWNSNCWKAGDADGTCNSGSPQQLDMAPNQLLTIEYYIHTTAGHTAGSVTSSLVTASGTRSVGIPAVTQTFTATDQVYNMYTTSDVSLTKASDVATAAAPGDTVTYTIVVTNTGATTLNDVNLFDELPAGVTYVPGSADITTSTAAGCAATIVPNAPPNFLNSTSNCDMTTGTTFTLTFQVTVDDPLTSDIMELTNTATVTSNEIFVPIQASVTDPLVKPTTGTASVGDQVWIDTNGNGVVDVGEAGIPNVEVTLKDQFGTPLQTTTTDSQGRYLFTGVPFGYDYYVEITAGLPAGLTQVVTTGSGNKTNSFDLYAAAPPGNNRDNFGTVAYANNDGSVNFDTNWTESADGGAANSPSAGNILITGGELRLNNQNDATANTIQRELGVPGSAAGAILSFTYRTTGVETADVITLEISADGGSTFQPLRTFTNLAGTTAGSYSADISSYLSPNTILRFSTGSTYRQADDLFFIDNFDITYSAAPIQEYLSADLGYQPVANTAVIGDRVWSDADADGVQDAGEPGLGGITVRLYPDTNGNGSIDDTNAVDLLSGLLDLNGDGSITSVDTGGVVDNGGTTRGVINGLLDFNNDGVINASDSGSVNLGGTNYTLTNGVLSGGTDPTPAIVNFRSVVTEPDGSYLFNVAATGTQDYIAAIPATQAALTGYHVTTLGQYSFSNVVSMGSYRTADFGVQQDAAGSTYSVQDRIWRDTNGDGDQDVGEPGIAGVTVDLLDASGNVIATTTTDSNGLISFAGVPSGVRYSWRITDIGGVLSNYFGTTASALAGVFQMPNTLDEADDVADGTNDDVLNYSDPANASPDYRPHFGFNLSRSIGDTVFNDLGGTNGVQDAGEPGISGVTVKLYNDVDGDGVIDAGVDLLQATVITDSSGNYLFSGLADGNYIVSIESPPTGYTYTGIAPMLDSDGGTAGQQNAASIASGVSDLTNDFAYRASGTPRTLSGVLWTDTGLGGGVANNGVQDGTEPGIAGVTIDLYQDTDGDGVIDPGEPVIGTTTTVAGGGYSFAGLPGTGTQDYIVRVTDTNGVLSGYDTTFERTELTTAPFNGRESVLNLNGDVTNINFGYNILVAATYASVTNFTASADPADGRVLVQWETLLESGTVGFYLERQDATGVYQRLHSELLTAVLYSPLGGFYAFADNGVKAGETHRYRLREVEADGDMLTHGPYSVTVKSLSPVAAANDTAASNGISVSALANAAKAQGYARQAKAFGTGRTRADSIDTPAGISLPTPAGGGLTVVTQAKLPVTADGLNYVSAATLAEYLGTSLDQMKTNLAAGQISLSMGGNSVAYTVAAGNVGLYFVGERYENRYTAQNTYWVTRNQAGSLMSTVTGTAPTAVTAAQSYQDSKTAETNTYLIPYAPRSADADVWYWGFVNVGGTSPSGPYTLNVDAPGAVGTGTASLTLYLQGASDLATGTDHHAEIWVNGTKVGETQWNGQNTHSTTVSFNGSLLRTVSNQIQVSGVLDAGVTFSSFLIDKLDLSYQRAYQAVNDALRVRGDGNAVVTVTGFTGSDVVVFELANPTQPVLLDAVKVEAAGVGYRASFSPRSPGVDYWVTRLNAAAQPTPVTEFGSDLKASDNGADYLIIAPAELQPGAEALAAYRSARFQTQVVLLQDIYDEFNAGRADAAAIQDFLNTVQSWQQRPQYVVLVGKGTLDPRNYLGLGTNRLPVMLAPTPDGLYQADGLYADVQGNDGIPDYALGRIPAQTNAEVQVYVSKLMAFETATAQSPKALLVADNADTAGNFPQDSSTLAGLLPSVTVTTVHHDAVTPATTTRQAILTALNGGVSLFNYLGHGSPSQFADEGLLRSSDVTSLNNSHLPVFGAFSCYLGYGSIPGLNSLADDLTLKGSGGVIASLAPTGLSRNDHAAVLSQGFIPALASGQTVGAAANAARSGAVPVYLRSLYNLFGDPAVVAR